MGGPSYPGPSALSVNYPPYEPAQFPTQPEYPSYPMPQPVGAMMPMVRGGMLATRFPALWAAVVTLSERFGTRISVDRIWQMFKTFGPGMVALIGGQAFSELMVYHSTHKRRRMNVANTKALRRSVRRLKGFDRLSHRVSGQLARAGGKRRTARRCGTCRKSPCTC